MVATSPKVATPSASHCPGAGSCLGGRLDDVQIEHEVRQRDAGQARDHLDDDVGRRTAWSDLAPQQEGQRDRRVEVGAGDRPEHGDQHGEDGAGGQRVADQRDGVVSGGEVLGHDPGTHHGGEQEQGAECLGGEFPQQDYATSGAVLRECTRECDGSVALWPREVAGDFAGEIALETRVGFVGQSAPSFPIPLLVNGRRQGDGFPPRCQETESIVVGRSFCATPLAAGYRLERR